MWYAGQYNDTYILFLSDHGEMNMEHRQGHTLSSFEPVICFGIVWKNSMYEPSERVPMMLAGPVPLSDMT